jgi:hypothetical protein
MLVSTYPRSSQVVNGSHIVKCYKYYIFIMKDEGIKNHGVRITNSLQPLSPVSYSREIGRRTGRMYATGMNYQETTQQLRKAKLAIIELYQQNI